MSDLFPAQEGSGLGFSSSLIVSTLHSLYALKEKRFPRKDWHKKHARLELTLWGILLVNRINMLYHKVV